MINCIICGKEFVPYKRSISCSDECKKIRNRQRQAKYSKTEKRKACIKRYTQTEKFKNNVKRYQSSEKGKISLKRNSNKNTYKEYLKKYHKEYQKGEVAQRYKQSVKYKEIRHKIQCERKRNLGFNNLNSYFIGAQAHHINMEDVIYIPINYHFHGHSARKNKNMEPINTVAFFFLMMQNINKLIEHYK